MIPFVPWLKERKFRVENWWDYAAGRWELDGYMELLPIQEVVLNAAFTPDAQGRLPYTTLLYSTIKKSGKSTVAAAVGAWAADQFRPGSEIYVLSNDKDQAEQRVFKSIVYHVQKEVPDAYVTSDLIVFKNGTTIRVMATENVSAAGGAPALTLWDELWGFRSESDRRMWVEMGPVPTVPISIRFVSSYAGYESESHLLYDLYLRGVGKDEHPDGRGKAIPNELDAPIWSQGRLFTYWDHEPRAPWQTDEYYAEQEADPTLRASDILRIHHNQWASSLETFIPSEWWIQASKAQTRSAEIWADHPYRKAPVFVGVDVAPKHDTSAVVGVTYDSKLGKVVLLFHEIWNPKGIDLDLEATVEKYILDHAKRFNVRSVDYDPYQMLRSAKTLKNRLVPMREFPQTADNMVQASQCLYNLLKDNDLWAYPEPRAAQHVKNAAAVVTPRGARIVKDPRLRNNSNLAVRSSKPVDFAVALAMACYAAIELGDVDISRPLLIPSNTADLSTWAEVDLEQAWLPQPLRS